MTLIGQNISKYLKDKAIHSEQMFRKLTHFWAFFHTAHRLLKKFKVSQKLNFWTLIKSKRHNSSTTSISKLLFSIFKNPTRIMTKHKISCIAEDLKGLKSPSTFCNLFLKSRYESCQVAKNQREFQQMYTRTQQLELKKVKQILVGECQ